MRPNSSNTFQGIAASPGISIGKAFVLQRDHWVVNRLQLSGDEKDKEVNRFQKAVKKTKTHLQKVKERAQNDIGQKHTYIFDAHIMILEDDLLIDETINRIKEEGVNAEWALKSSLDRFTQRFRKVKDEYLKERIQDIEHVIHALMENLMGHGVETLKSLPENVILISHNLGPADTLQMDRDNVLAFATDIGGKTAHVALIATSLFIPAVVGLKTVTRNVKSGDMVIVDGYDGTVIIHPSEEQLKHYLDRKARFQKYSDDLQEIQTLPAETQDGVVVRLEANMEYSWEIEAAKKYGAEGVGLFRTEYLYVENEKLPTEEELYAEYKRVAEGILPHSAIIRTIDIGGDKIPSDQMREGGEPNPALGLRAIRLCLSRVHLFKTQLRAILRASQHGNLKIMYPMISNVQELLDANQILAQAKDELDKEQFPFQADIPVGIMIETPSAALISDILARHADFFSIGTNDLIQYSLAIDRVNEYVAYLYDPLHLGILRLIQSVLQSAEKADIPVGICGGMGGDPTYVLVLLGLGKIDELSMDPQSIPWIKKMLRSISKEDCKNIAEGLLTTQSQQEIRALVKQNIAPLIKKALPDKSLP